MQTKLPTPNAPNIWEDGPIPPLKMDELIEQPYLRSGCTPEMSIAACRASAVRAAEMRAAKRRVHQVWVLVLIGLLSLMAYYAISRFVVTPVVIQGRSMNPTLRDGECYLLNRWVYLFKRPERGDLVVIKDPGHDDFAVKRVIGKPGDWINIRDGQVFLNGQRLSEPYLSHGVMTFTPDYQEKWIQLGRNQYFVMGDNRQCSEDSRTYGRVLKSNILGTISM